LSRRHLIAARFSFLDRRLARIDTAGTGVANAICEASFLAAALRKLRARSAQENAQRRNKLTG
jgi:hypothetical protein